MGFVQAKHVLVKKSAALVSVPANVSSKPYSGTGASEPYLNIHIHIYIYIYVYTEYRHNIRINIYIYIYIQRSLWSH